MWNFTRILQIYEVKNSSLDCKLEVVIEQQRYYSMNLFLAVTYILRRRKSCNPLVFFLNLNSSKFLLWFKNIKMLTRKSIHWKMKVYENLRGRYNSNFTYVLFCTIICSIFTSLCKNFVKLNWVLAEAFRFHVHWHRKASAKTQVSLTKFLQSEVKIIHIIVQNNRYYRARSRWTKQQQVG